MKNVIKINSITFPVSFRNIPEGFSLEFKFPVTILAGDNGAGKSTILNAIRANIGDGGGVGREHKRGTDTALIGKAIFDCTAKSFPIIAFDAEADNKKRMTYFDFSGKSFHEQMKAMRSSSGQAVLDQFMNSGIFEQRNGVVILDEPEYGLSIKNQIKIAKLLMTEIASKGNQWIVSTHSPELLRLADEHPDKVGLYSMDSHHYSTWVDFHKSQCDEI